MSDSIKIGDTLYRFDRHYRCYDKPGLSGRIIYRKHFRPEVVTGESKGCWLIHYNTIIVWKINKKTMTTAGKNGYPGLIFYTAEGMEDDIWRWDHHFKIERLVSRASAAQLQEIAKIVGYEAGE